MVPSGYAAKNARKPITWSVLLKIKKKKSSFPFFALLMNVGGRGPVKQLVKWVTIPTLFSVGPRQKTTAKKIRQGKDGRRIAPRKDASAGRDNKEQKWKVEDLDLVFDLWERNKTLPLEQRLSKNQIHKQTGVPYTTVCECLSGRRGEENMGRLLEARGHQKSLKKVQAGNQAGNRLRGDQLPACFPLLRPVYFLQIDQEDRLVSIVMMYACRGFPFTEVQLCKLAYQIAVSEKKTGFSPTKKRAGRSWLKYFYKRQLDLKKKVVSKSRMH